MGGEGRRKEAVCIRPRREVGQKCHVSRNAKVRRGSRALQKNGKQRCVSGKFMGDKGLGKEEEGSSEVSYRHKIPGEIGTKRVGKKNRKRRKNLERKEVAKNIGQDVGGWLHYVSIPRKGAPRDV